MRTRAYLGATLLAAFFTLALPALAHAQSLFRLFPEAQVGGFYGDNVPLRTSNAEGDFAGTALVGFYLDYTSEARYASLHYDTFAQLFAQQSRFDRAGEGQFVSATDNEKISSTTTLRFDELFYRDAPTSVPIIVSEQGPQFNHVSAQLLLANDQATVNWFNAILHHRWGHRLSSTLSVHQSTYWTSNKANNNASFDQSVSALTEYHFTNHFTLGLGYRFYDFRFTAAGQPGEEAHEPHLRLAWAPIEHLYLSGTVGVVVAYTQGTNQQAVSPSGTGQLEYYFHHAHLSVYGGQEPEVSTLGHGSAGEYRGVRGRLVYQFTRRLSGSAGGGYYQVFGAGVNSQLISWGFRLNNRVNRWLSAYAGFTEIRRNGTGSTQFLSGGTGGREAVGNYFFVGFTASTEAFRWSWQ